ncbi:MAG TPA: flippase [Acidimicrobiales bacterium]|nr:flippase [Acidimicrobiales bacterium]
MTADASEDLGDQGELLRVARGGGLNLAGAAFNQALRFGITLLLARLVGQSDVGRYFQAFAFLALLGLLALSGFRGALTRFVAVHRADGDDAALRGTLRLGLALPTIGAAVLGLALFAASGWIGRDALNDAAMVFPLRIVSLALPATAFTDAALAATQGYRTMTPYALVNLVFEPAFRVVLTLGFLAADWGLKGAMVALLITNCAAAVLAGGWLRRLTGRITAAPAYKWRELFAFSTVSWLASLASTGLVWADTIILGVYRPAREVGAYQVATRLTVLATIVLLPIATSFAPQIADLYRRGNLERLARLYAVVTSWTLRLSLPGFIVLVIFPRPLLHVFGRGFAGAATVTVILAVGQMFDVATGPTGYMLVMSGRPYLTMANNVFALVINISMNVWLIPRHGIRGAAVAWAVSLALINIAKVVQVWVTMRMHAFDAGFAKGCLAGALAFAPGVLVHAAMPGFPGVMVGAVAILIVYVGALLALGLRDEDRVVLRRLATRAGLRTPAAQL